MTEVNYCDLAKKWWVQAATPELTRKSRNKKIVDAIYNAAEMSGVDTTGLDVYLKQLLPRKSKRDPEKVAYYDNSYKYDRDTLTAVASGKFLKKVVPTATDVMVEAFSIFWKENIAFDPTDYILHIGTTREDFKNAFINYRRSSGISWSETVKSISDSCMRYGFNNLPAHPAEVYASGDFEVVAIRDKRGKTKARCVVRTKQMDGSSCYIYNTIYAYDKHCVELIQEYLDSKRGVHCGREGWHGAKLLAIKVDDKSHRMLCPFIDGFRYLQRSKDESFIVVLGEKYADKAGCYWFSNSTYGYINFYPYDQEKVYFNG